MSAHGKPAFLSFLVCASVQPDTDEVRSGLHFPYLRHENNKKQAERSTLLVFVVELKAAKTHTIIYKINHREIYCQVDFRLSDYPLYGKQLVASRG